MQLLPWILVFHLIGLVLWVGSLLIVMPVLVIDIGEPSPEARQALSRVEIKLLRGMAHPGAAVVVISGVLMVLTNTTYYLHAHWLHVKLLLVLVLIALDLRIAFRARAFQAGKIELTRRECQTLASIIGVTFIVILILVSVKPF